MGKRVKVKSVTHHDQAKTGLGVLRPRFHVVRGELRNSHVFSKFRGLWLGRELVTIHRAKVGQELAGDQAKYQEKCLGPPGMSLSQPGSPRAFLSSQKATPAASSAADASRASSDQGRVNEVHCPRVQGE